MGRAKGGLSAAVSAPRRGAAAGDGFGVVFGTQRGSEDASYRCAQCGARGELSAQPDGRAFCGLCAAAAERARVSDEFDARLHAATDPLLAGLEGASLERKVEAYLAAGVAAHAVADALEKELRHQRQRRHHTSPGLDTSGEEERLQLQIDRAQEYYRTVAVLSLPQREENKLIRRDLQAAFPATKFSVSHRSGYGVSVSWTDGPAEGEVEAVTGRYVSQTHRLDQWGEHETRSSLQYVEGADGRPVKVSSGSLPNCERRLSPEWNAELRAELAHLTGDPELLSTTDDPHLDIDTQPKGLFTPVSGLENWRRPTLAAALSQVAKYRRREQGGRVVLAGGSANDGLTPWAARNAEREQSGWLPEPEPDFALAPAATPTPSAPASGEEPLTTVASLKRRLEAGVELTCTANTHSYQASEVGETREVGRIQGNLVRLAPAPGLPKGHDFYFPSKAELRVTGPDSFDVLGSDGSLQASYSVGAKPAAADLAAPKFARRGANAKIDKEGALSFSIPFHHGGRQAGEFHVSFSEGAAGEAVPEVHVMAGSLYSRHAKWGMATLIVGHDREGRAQVDWDLSKFEGDRPSEALRKHAEAALVDVDVWLRHQQQAGRRLADLVTANS